MATSQGACKRRGLSILELVVTLLSLSIVGTMGFHLLITHSQKVHMHLSISSRSERLRLLQRMIDQDLAAVFPFQDASSIHIASATIEGATQAANESLLLESDILVQEATRAVSLKRIAYALVKDASIERSLMLVRREKMLEGESSPLESASRDLFRILPEERLTWSVNKEVASPTSSISHLVLKFTDSRFGLYTVEREMLIPGNAP